MEIQSVFVKKYYYIALSLERTIELLNWLLQGKETDLFPQRLHYNL